MMLKLCQARLTRQLLAFLLGVSIIPLLVLGYTSTETSKTILQEQVRRNTVELMVKQKDYLELLLDGIESLIANISSVDDVKKAILETNGQISLYYYEDEDVKAGLSILPSRFTDRFITIPHDDEYACVRCSAILTLRAGDKQLCPRCANAEWSKVSRVKRVT